MVSSFKLTLKEEIAAVMKTNWSQIFEDFVDFNLIITSSRLGALFQFLVLDFI